MHRTTKFETTFEFAQRGRTERQDNNVLVRLLPINDSSNVQLPEIFPEAACGVVSSTSGLGLLFNSGKVKGSLAELKD